VPDPVRYCPASGVAWTVEKDGILLVHQGAGAVRRLRYPEAAAWGWFSRSEAPGRVAWLTGLVGRLEPGAAERLVRETIASWVEAGILVVEGADG